MAIDLGIITYCTFYIEAYEWAQLIQVQLCDQRGREKESESKPDLQTGLYQRQMHTKGSKPRILVYRNHPESCPSLS